MYVGNYRLMGFLTQLEHLIDHRFCVASIHCIFIFRKYSILERNIFKSDSVIFLNAMFQLYIPIEGCQLKNSTHINLAACNMYL